MNLKGEQKYRHSNTKRPIPSFFKQIHLLILSPLVIRVIVKIGHMFFKSASHPCLLVRYMFYLGITTKKVIIDEHRS